MLLAKRVRRLGRTPILFCNTTRSETAQIAIERAHSGRDYLGGVKNIKLEVTKKLLLRGKIWLVPRDDEVVIANKRLVGEDFNTVPLIGCYTGNPGNMIDTAKQLIDDGANGIRFCVGGVGLGTGIENPGLFGRVIEGVRAHSKVPLIAECGMNPKSIRQARKLLRS